MDRIEDFQAFVAIVEKQSLTAAARHLGRLLQSASRSLAALEREVGVELVSGQPVACRGGRDGGVLSQARHRGRGA